MRRFLLALSASTIGIYGVWLAPLLARGAPGSWRALATCIGAALLIEQGAFKAGTAQPRSARDRRLALALALTAGLAALPALHTPVAWALVLALLAAANLMGLHGAQRLARQPLLVPLAAAGFPFEAVLPPPVDTLLQRLTAEAAAWLVNASGLPVTLQIDPPALLGPRDLVVSVTALCAGAATLFALTTLGMLLAELAFEPLAAKLLCVLMTPAFGLAGNVLRVALSTHAANWWAEDALAWNLAHDGIGYATFGLTYLALFACVRALRQWRPRARLPAISSSASGQSVASP